MDQINDWTEYEADPAPPPPVKSKEDLEFEQMYEKMTSDSYQERLKEPPLKATNKDIPVPMMARLQKKSYEQLLGNNACQISKTAYAGASAAAVGAGATDVTCNLSATATATSCCESPVAESASSSASGSGGKNNGAVPFVLMVRGNKGGKQQFKTFVAPSDSQLAINLKLQEQKTREEKEKVKRLTLNITERIEEEDYQESLLPQQQRNFTQSYYQKPNKHKFKHQKGAPDVDFIFH